MIRYTSHKVSSSIQSASRVRSKFHNSRVDSGLMKLDHAGSVDVLRVPLGYGGEMAKALGGDATNEKAAAGMTR